MDVLLVRRELREVELPLPADEAHHQHVGIVPVPRAGEGCPLVLAEPLRGHARPGVADVAGGAPGVGVGRPFVCLLERGGVREAVDDVPPAVTERVAHLAHVLDVVRVPVVLQVVEAPLGPLASVGPGERIPAVAAPDLLLVDGAVPGPFGIVGGAAHVAGVGRDPRSRVDADLQSQGVDLVGEALEVGKLLVRLDRVVGAAALALPGVVDVHVAPAVLDEARLHHRAGGRAHLRGVDEGTAGVPAVPAEGRRQGQAVPADDAQLALGLAEHVLGGERHDVLAGRRHRARDATRARVELQARGQVHGAVGHGPLAGGGDREEEGMTRPHPEDLRPVDAGGGRGLGGQDEGRVVGHRGRGRAPFLLGKSGAAERQRGHQTCDRQGPHAWSSTRLDVIVPERIAAFISPPRAGGAVMAR